MSADAEAGPGHDTGVSLPAERSFVLQFRAGIGPGPSGPSGPSEQWAGRVEHVVSGRAARFDNHAALCEFIIAVLAECGQAHQGD